MSDIEQNKASSIPTIKISRNEFGLINDGSVYYTYNDKGNKINWRKMIDPKYLVVHKQAFLRKNKPIPESIEGLEDNELLILLGGIKELARIRGYDAVTQTLTSPSADYVSSVCHITWIPNFETENRTITFAGVGDAHERNTSGIARNYLAAIAENRAFVRCVRNFLGIEILGQEEIGENGTSVDQQKDMATNLLQETMLKYNIPLEAIKLKLIEEKIENADKITSIDQIPRFKQFELIERIKKKAAERSQTS